MLHGGASRTALVALIAPQGIIGVGIALAVFRKPFNFIAFVGVIAMEDMTMRKSVILIDQIRQDLADGRSVADAIIESAVRRFRAIVLKAMASRAGHDPGAALDLLGVDGGLDNGWTDRPPRPSPAWSCRPSMRPSTVSRRHNSRRLRAADRARK